MSSTQSTTTLTRKRQSFNPSNVVIQSTPVGTRSSMPGFSVSRKSNVVSSSRGYGGGPGMNRPQGEAQRLSRSTVDSLASTRGKEKKDLNELNTKLAGYLENTRFLEATVKALTEEIERLKKSKGFNQERIREEYKDELQAAYDALAELKKELAAKQANILSLQDKLDSKDEELDDAKRQRDQFKVELAKASNIMGELEGELAAHRKNVENLEREKATLNEDVERLKRDNDRIRLDCEAARRAQINACDELQALQAEFEFVTETDKMENDELRALIEELRNVAPKIQDKWKSDFKEMIKVIQDDYNERIAIMTEDCRRKYEDELIAIQNNTRRDNTDGNIIKNENKTLKSQIPNLKDKINKLEDDLMMWKNSVPRDQTDHVSKTENKTLKSSLSQSKTKMAELERENARLLRELAELQRKYDEECEDCEKEKEALRAEIEGISEDLGEVMDAMNQIKDEKLSLELEISCYRKLLEGEESKMARSIEQRGNVQSQGGAALASMISGGGGGAQSSQSSNPKKDKPGKTPADKPTAKPADAGAGSQPQKPKAPEPVITMSETSGSVKMQRASKGQVQIKDVDQGGAYITLSNSHRSREIDIANWEIKRTYVGRDSKTMTSKFRFPAGTNLAAGEERRVVAYNFDDAAKGKDLIAPKETCKIWGFGSGEITVTDSEGTVKATCNITYQ